MTAKRNISVILPTFNRGALLPRAIHSILDQTYPVKQLIVVDDGSTDDTREVVERLAGDDARIQYIWQQNGGAPSARNRGLEVATGDLIAFQDSDDSWHPKFLEVLERAHTSSQTVVFSSLNRVSADGSREVTPSIAVMDVKRQLLSGNCISTQTALVDRKLFLTHRFDESLPRLQDWDLWLSMSGDASFVHIAEPLVDLFEQLDSISAVRVDYYIALRVIVRKHWRALAKRPVSLARLAASAWLRAPRR